KLKLTKNPTIHHQKPLPELSLAFPKQVVKPTSKSPPKNNNTQFICGRFSQKYRFFISPHNYRRRENERQTPQVDQFSVILDKPSSIESCPSSFPRSAAVRIGSRTRFGDRLCSAGVTALDDYRSQRKCIYHYKRQRIITTKRQG